MAFLIQQLLNSIAYGSLLFMIAGGFSLIFGLMRLTNVVHVVYFTAGCYIGYWIYNSTGSFLLAILAGAVIIGFVGFVVFKGFLFKLSGNWQSQLLLCLGFLFLFDDALSAIFTPWPQQTPTPAALSRSIDLFGMKYPLYRLFLIVIGVVIIVIMELIINRTKVGALVRSGVDDTETTRSMGINIDKLFVAVYVGASALAGIGGVLGGVTLGMEPKMCFNLLPLALAIVIIGGMGNIKGAFYGSMIVAMLDNFGRALFPELAYFTIFLPMAVILVVAPDGLFNRRKAALPAGQKNSEKKRR